MLCKNCGFEAKEGAKYCKSCGERFFQEGTTQENEFVYNDNMYEIKMPKSISPKSGYVLGMIISVIVVVIGILYMDCKFVGQSNATISSYESFVITGRSVYGADAYTGIQNACADTSNNVVAVGNLLESSIKMQKSLMNTVSNSVGSLILCVGLISFCYFLIGYQKSKM